MKIKKIEEVKPEIPQMPGTKNVTIQWLFTKNDGAPHYAMRLFTIKPGGEIPVHSHTDMEHEILIIEGEAMMKDGISEVLVKRGDALLILPNEKHGFTNNSNIPFRFICVIPLLK
jgi:quercetin dioxygenase-like cupin family protein|uniref:Cupin domain-containing protein n=1 Tax=candidate division WOR-3 bacterium TaxID=2052148 RepID=A0A7C4XK84_UNCW3